MHMFLGKDTTLVAGVFSSALISRSIELCVQANVRNIGISVKSRTQFQLEHLFINQSFVIAHTNTAHKRNNHNHDNLCVHSAHCFTRNTQKKPITILLLAPANIAQSKRKLHTSIY